MPRSFLSLLTAFALGCALLAQAPAPSALPRLAILPLKEEGEHKLGDVSDTMNTLVANAFLESRSFQLVERHQVQTILAESKYQHSGLVDEGTLAEMGKHLGVGYVLVGSFLPERDARNGGLVITLSLRLVDVANATVYRSFQEIADGSTLGGTLAKLTDRLTARTATLAPRDLTEPGNPRLRKGVLVLRLGSVTCVKQAQTHAEPADLAFFNEKLEDYEFLQTEVSRRFPPETKLVLEKRTYGGLEGLVREHKPDALVLITFNRTGKIHAFSQESEHRVEVRVEFLDPKTLNVTGATTVTTDLIKGKLYEVFPRIKEQLAQRIAKEIGPLPGKP